MEREADINREYWNALAKEYQTTTAIALNDFHYGPLVPGDRRLGLLPRNPAGMRCLELGCGAAQNSIYLATRGAVCTALDVAEHQLHEGRLLARRTGVRVHFVCADMRRIPMPPSPCFDLIHSSFGLPFTRAPAELIHQSADRLKPGGQLLISLMHPVFAAEWLEIEGEGEGAFVTNYFSPPVDERAVSGNRTIASHTFPVGDVVRWILEAGLELTALREPQPAQPPDSAPYRSDDWEAWRDKAAHVPVALICRARKPNAATDPTTASTPR